MIGKEELQEIEMLGREEPGQDREEFGETEGKKKRGSFLPLLQAAICLLLLLGLLILKFSDAEKFDQFSSWYRAEALREIELPEFQTAPKEEKGESGAREEKNTKYSSVSGIIQRAVCWNLL